MLHFVRCITLASKYIKYCLKNTFKTVISVYLQSILSHWESPQGIFMGKMGTWISPDMKNGSRHREVPASSSPLLWWPMNKKRLIRPHYQNTPSGMSLLKKHSEKKKGIALCFPNAGESYRDHLLGLPHTKVVLSCRQFSLMRWSNTCYVIMFGFER